jgi:hypothetical protein
VINQLVRYAPLLKRLEGETGSILEIGSGPDGIASYLRRQCVGLEINFHTTPDPYLIPVAGTATHLPFTDRAFDIVLIMDTMEHIPVELRADAISEAGRVCRGTLIVGGPMGAAARTADDRLASHYAMKGIELPDWLREHLTRRAPDVNEVRDWMSDAGFEVVVEPNEGLRNHMALMRFEVSRFGGRITDRVRKHAPKVVLPLARRRPKGAVYSWLLTGRRPGDPAEVPAVPR